MSAHISRHVERVLTTDTQPITSKPPRVVVLNTKTGRIFKQFNSLKDAEECLENLDYEAPKLSRHLDIREYTR
jgi:hypothetical protein